MDESSPFAVSAMAFLVLCFGGYVYLDAFNPMTTSTTTKEVAGTIKRLDYESFSGSSALLGYVVGGSALGLASGSLNARGCRAGVHIIGTEDAVWIKKDLNFCQSKKIGDTIPVSEVTYNYWRDGKIFRSAISYQ